MKLLFTGASGFLGTNIIDLLREKFEVVERDPMVVLHAGAKVYGTNDEEQEFYQQPEAGETDAKPDLQQREGAKGTRMGAAGCADKLYIKQ